MTDVEVLARTIYGEARGEPLDGKVAVASVIINRAESGGWFGDSIKKVCLKPWQFSCWNQNDPNREEIQNVDETNRLFCECLMIADLAVHGLLIDNTNGANHYYAKAIPEPYWSKGKEPVAEIGGHAFFDL